MKFLLTKFKLKLFKEAKPCEKKMALNENKIKFYICFYVYNVSRGENFDLSRVLKKKSK